MSAGPYAMWPQAFADMAPVASSSTAQPAQVANQCAYQYQPPLPPVANAMRQPAPNCALAVAPPPMQMHMAHVQSQLWHQFQAHMSQQTQVQMAQTRQPAPAVGQVQPMAATTLPNGSFLAELTACKLCSVRCGTWEALERHTRIRHIGIDDLHSFKCAMCGYVTQFAMHLVTHKIIAHHDVLLQLAGSHASAAGAAAQQAANVPQTAPAPVQPTQLVGTAAATATVGAPIADGAVCPITKMVRTVNSVGNQADDTRRTSRSRTHSAAAEKRPSGRPDELRVFPCPHADCDFVARLRVTLRRHVLNRHTDPQTVPRYDCPTCVYTTKFRKDLREHLIRQHKVTLVTSALDYCRSDGGADAYGAPAVDGGGDVNDTVPYQMQQGDSRGDSVPQGEQTAAGGAGGGGGKASIRLRAVVQMDEHNRPNVVYVSDSAEDGGGDADATPTGAMSPQPVDEQMDISALGPHATAGDTDHRWPASERAVQYSEAVAHAAAVSSSAARVAADTHSASEGPRADSPPFRVALVHGADEDEGSDEKKCLRLVQFKGKQVPVYDLTIDI